MAASQNLPIGLSPYEAALFIHDRLVSGSKYAHAKKSRFRRWAASIKLASLALSAASTVILGLQDLGTWAGLAFSLVALLTVVNSIEPYFNWRSRWVLMEEAQANFQRLSDDLMYLLAKTPPDQLDFTVLDPIFQQHQDIWNNLSRRWIQHRNLPASEGSLG